eukprot:jgi/Psemu1/15183/gm1.15183_g
MRVLFLIVLLSVAAPWFGTTSSTSSSSGSIGFARASSEATTTTSPALYRVRRRIQEFYSDSDSELASASASALERKRALNSLVPSFSADDKETATARMPDLTLLLTGVEGLGDRSYDVLQTAMNDYLKKVLTPYFSSKYELLRVETKASASDGRRRQRHHQRHHQRKRRALLNDASAAGTSTVDLETTLVFAHTPGDSDPTASERTHTSAGEQMALSARMGPTDSNSVPSDVELELAAAEAWNDLTVFRNYLMVAAAVEGTKAFDGIRSVDATTEFPTSTVDVAEDEEAEPDEIILEEESENDKEKQPASSGLNVAAASSQQLSKKSGTDRLNPLWPALIVGMAVFLITTIVLGYRRQRAAGNLGDNDDHSNGSSDVSSIWRGFGGVSGRKFNRKKHASILVHVNDGRDGEIEVEDQAYKHSSKSPNRSKARGSHHHQRKQREIERNLDKAYAASCLGPAKDALSPIDYHADEYPVESRRSRSHKGKGKKSCLPSRRKGNNKDRTDEEDDYDYDTENIPLQRQDSMALDRKQNQNHSRRGIDLPREVDLTNDRSIENHAKNNGKNSRRRRSQQDESWRNPARLDHLADAAEQDCDMTPHERDTFVRYMQSGMTLEEASSQVLRERNMQQKLATNSYGSSGRSNQESAVAQQSLRDGDRDARYGKSKINRIPYNDSGTNMTTDSYYTSGMNIGRTPKAMVVTDASSCASSYHDSEFARAIGETAMAMLSKAQPTKNVTSRGFEPPPIKTTALTLRLRPLGHNVSCALPTELIRREDMTRERLELPTFGSGIRSSTN